LTEDAVANLRAFAVGFGNHYNEYARGPASLVDAALNLHHRLFTLYQLLVEPCAFTFKQQMTGKREGIKRVCSPFRNFPTERKGRNRRELVDKNTFAFGDFLGLGDIHRWRAGLAGNRRKILFYQP